MSTLKENVQKVVDANAAMGTAMESFGIPGGVGSKLTDKVEVLEDIARCLVIASVKKIGLKAYASVLFDKTCKGDLLVGNALLLTNIKTLTYMASMFDSCTGLTSITFPDGFDLSACKNCSYMFYVCNSLTAVPDVLDLSACTNCLNMFGNCSSLSAVPTHLTANGENNLQISFASSALVSKASVEAMAENLNDLTGSAKPPTVTFSSATKALFTTDEWTALKTKFADKGWNVSPA